jgi:RNA polymerase primary sigma factor
MFELVGRIRRETHRFVQDHGREPTSEEIAAALEIEVAKVTMAQRCGRQPVSLETPVGEDGDASLGDRVADTVAVSPLDAAMSAALAMQTERLLETLTPREAKVLRLRFGIGERGEHTLEEVGQRFAVTRERIRQIEAKALARLRARPSTKVWRTLIDG